MKTKVFCSFCRVPHKIYVNKHISLIAIIAIGLVSATFSFLVWSDFHYASMIIFFVLCFWMEFFTRYRWRQSLKCSTCGFDPVIYKLNPEDAAKIVKSYLEKRKEDPSFLLKPQPQIKPIIRRQQETPKGITSHIEIENL